MKRVYLPRTTLMISRVGMGTGSLHHLRSERLRQELLGAAMDAGITHFDTAPMYGEGMAERSLGRLFRGRDRDSFTVGTKVGFPARRIVGRLPWLMYVDKGTGVVCRKLGICLQRTRRRDLTEQGVRSSVHQSLKNLGLERVDLLLVHEPDPAEADALRKLGSAFDGLKKSGAVRCVGLAGAAASCAAIASSVPGVFDVLQVEDSIADREADSLPAAGLPIQITYGYMRRAAQGVTNTALTEPVAAEILMAALQRNRAGMVLVSSQRPSRVAAMAAVCRGAEA